MKKKPILSKCYEKNRNKSVFGDNYPSFSLTKIGFFFAIPYLVNYLNYLNYLFLFVLFTDTYKESNGSSIFDSVVVGSSW